MGAILFRGKEYQAKKKFFQGTHRILSPESTWEKIAPYAQMIGVTRLAHIAGLDRIGMPVTAAIRPLSSTIVTASGKGLSWAAARVSGLMEALEVYCAEQCDLPLISCSYQDLSQCKIPQELLPFSKYSAFHPAKKEEWVLGWDLFRQEEVAAPLHSVALNYQKHKKPSSFQTNSNGIASGNHFLEALLSGLYEVIERDGASCHHFAAATTSFTSPNINLSTIPYPSVQDLLQKLSSVEIGVLITDCSVDTRVPIFMATVWDRKWRHVGITRGYGAHLDPEVAMLRAVTEAIQSRAVFIAGARDDIFHPQFQLFKKMDSEDERSKLESADTTVDASTFSSQATEVLEDDLHLLLKKLQTQVLVFDLSRPEFDVSVVRVVVPGLEGYYSHLFVPGERALKFAALHSKTPQLQTVQGFHLPAGALV